MPSPRTSHSAVIDESTNKLYVVCGSGTHFGSSNHGDIFELDLALHSWRQLQFTGDELTPRYGQTVVLFADRLYLFGGTSGARRLPMIGSVPSPRYKHAAGIFDHDKMLVFGGSENHNRFLNDVYAVNLNSLVWVRLECHGANPGGRFAHGLCILHDKAFIFGGNEDQRADLHILYIRARTWVKVDCTGSIPRGRLFIGMVLDRSRSTLMVWGGKETSSNPTRVNTLHVTVIEQHGNRNDESSFVDDLIGLLRSSVDADVMINDFQAAHQLLLRCRCPQMAERIVFDDRGPVLQVPYSNDVIEILLHFLYSDEIPAAIDDDVLVRTLLAATDLSLRRLIALCERRLRRRITVGRAAFWLQLMAGDERVALSALLKVYLEFHELKQGEKPGLDSLSILSPVRVPCPTIRNDLGRFRQMSWTEAETDSVPFDLRCQYGQSNRRFYAHRIILTARSRYFGSFAFRKGMQEGLTGVCKFPTPREGVLSECAFEALLDYLYCDEVAVDKEVAKELLQIDVVNFFGLTTRHLEILLKTHFFENSSIDSRPYQELLQYRPVISCSVS